MIDPFALTCRCHLCERTFWSRRDAGLCPTCDAREQAELSAPGVWEGDVPEMLPRYSRAWNQERLGVWGDEDA